MRAIDLHTHVVPQHIPSGAGRDHLWPSVVAEGAGRANIVIDGKLFRAIDSRCWDVDRRLADMEAEGVGAQALSAMPELLSYWLASADAAYLASLMNDTIAEMVAEAPGRFVGFGMVSLQDCAAAVAQLEAIAKAGLRGVEIGTHINGVPLGDQTLWPFYEAAEALGLAIFVHPLKPCGLDRIGGAPDVCLAASFPMEIAFAALSLVSAGVVQRFPRLRFLLSHGGGALANVLGRLSAARTLAPSVGKALPQDPLETARAFWCDSNVYDADTLRFIAKKLGEDRVVVGSDYPFAIRQTHPGAFVEAAQPGLVVRCNANASAFLFGDTQTPWPHYET